MMKTNRNRTSRTLRAFACAALLGGAVAAAVPEDAAVVGFSTTGPDRYADGTTVLDGESYALVWTREGVPFAGFNVDGSVVDAANAALLYAGPLAKGGRCEPLKVVVDPLLLKGYLANGALSLHLLDTRAWTADGAASVAGAARVQGATRVTEGVAVAADAAGPFRSATGGTAGAHPLYAASAVGDDVPAPRITGLRVEGDEIVLTVANTVRALNYAVSAGATPAADEDAHASAPVSGAASADATVELRVPRDPKAAAQFFRVGRRPLN